jgi:hypothetical protein
VAARVDDTARRFVQELRAAAPGSPAFDRALRKIEQIGDREIRATTQICARLSERATDEVESTLSDSSPLARHVREIHELADMRDGARREDRIRALAEALDSDGAALAADNALLGQEERSLFHQISALRRYALLAERLEELVDEAAAANGDVVYALRQRRRDVLLQLAVALQTYASVRLIEQRNLEVIWALRSAATTTLSALRSAGLARHAVYDEGWAEVVRVVDEIDARRRRTLSQIRSGAEPR